MLVDAQVSKTRMEGCGDGGREQPIPAPNDTRKAPVQTKFEPEPNVAGTFGICACTQVGFKLVDVLLTIWKVSNDQQHSKVGFPSQK